MDCHFQHINSTTILIADDVMIHGETDDQHDRHLLQMLHKCREIVLKLNQTTVHLGSQRSNFMAMSQVKKELSQIQAKLTLY